MKKLGLAALGAALILGLAGCDGEDPNSPIISILGDRSGRYLEIQARKDNTIIKDVIVNRGNCDYWVPIIRIVGVYKPQGECDDNKPFRTKKGECVGLGELIANTEATASFMLINKENKSLFESLDEGSKALFKTALPKKLEFGESHIWIPKCNGDILKVKLVTNLGDFEYDFSK